MIDREDHPKVTAKQMRLNMLTGKIEEEMKETIADSDSNSKLDADSDQFEFPIQIGTRVTKYYHNNEPDAFFIDPLIIESQFDWDQLLNEVTNLNTTTTITTVHKSYDDIDPPTQEDLEAAIAICDQYEFPPPEAANPQETELPDWD